MEFMNKEGKAETAIAQGLLEIAIKVIFDIKQCFYCCY
jgi:hypothetical protein